MHVRTGSWVTCVWMLAAAMGPDAYGQFSVGNAGYRRHSFALGGGGSVPRGDLRGLATSPALRVNYGYRFMKNFQADFGFESVFHAASVRDFYESLFGDLRIKDYQFFVPMGGRAVIPLASNRVQLSAGGGGAWMTYRERIRQPFGNSDFRIDCPVCAARSGWGYYGLVGASFALDRAQMFRLGFTTRRYRGRTDGDPLGPIPAVRTSDQWLSTTAEFSIHF